MDQIVNTNFWRTKRVLVTGATGFVGQCLCQQLSALDVDLYVLSRTRQTSDCLVSGKGLNVDLENLKTVQSVVRLLRPEIVYHLAGQVDTSRAPEMVLATFRNNLAASVNLFLALAEVGCERVVYSSSSEAYHSLLGTIANSPYAASKEAAAIYARMFYDVYALPVRIARIFVGYGPGQPGQKLIPYVIQSLLRGQRFQIKQGGRICDFIHVDDIVAGLLALGSKPGLEGESIDLGTGIGTTVNDVVHLIAELVGQPASFDSLPAPVHLPFVVQLADTVRSERLLGFCPRWGLRDGLEQTIEWYRQQLAME